MQSAGNKTIFAVVSFAYLTLSVFYMFYGNLHVDEGAYLYAARAVYRGEILYRDFFFLQPPGHPYVYGAIQTLLPGLLSGRILSLLLGFSGTLLLVHISRRMGYLHAGLIYYLLVASNCFILYFFTITRLYALTFFFLAAGCAALFHDKTMPSRSMFVSSVFFALALSTRLTVLPGILVYWLYILMLRKPLRQRIAALGLNVIVVGAVYLPFGLLAGWERLYFNLLGMNLSLHANALSASIIEKIRATSQLLRFNLFLAVISMPVLWAAFRHQPQLKCWKDIRSELLKPVHFFWLFTFSILTGHTAAKMYQVSYQAIIIPFFAFSVALGWEQIVHSRTGRNFWLLRFPLIIGCSLSLLSGIRDFVDLNSGQPAIRLLKPQVDFTKAHCPPGEMIFSADSALVPVLAGYKVLPGMSGSDLFPDWHDEKCRFFRVLNFHIMSEYIKEQRACLVIIGDMSFTLSLPYLEPISEHIREAFMLLVDQYYEEVIQFPNVYIPGTTTHYYIRRSVPSGT